MGSPNQLKNLPQSTHIGSCIFQSKIANQNSLYLVWLMGFKRHTSSDYLFLTLYSFFTLILFFLSIFYFLSFYFFHFLYVENNKIMDRCGVALFTNLPKLYFRFMIDNLMEGCFCEFVIYYRFRGAFTWSNVSALSKCIFLFDAVGCSGLLNQQAQNSHIVMSHIALEWGCAYMYKYIIYDTTRFKAVMKMNISELRS